MFAAKEEGYSALQIAYDQINKSIYEHKDFISFMAEMDTLFALWEREMDKYLKTLGKDCHPKKVIAEISEKILNVYYNKPLIDNYNVYQHLLELLE